MWLIVPAMVGTLAWMLHGEFTMWYGCFTMVWGVAFVEFWARRESEMATLWGTRGYSNVDTRNPHFKGDEIIKDPITGRERPYFAFWKRWLRYAWTIPIVFLLSIGLAVAVAAMFVMEVFLCEFYTGPFSDYLVLCLLVILTILLAISANSFVYRYDSCIE